MITLLYHMQSLKWVVPAAFMLGSAPTYCFAWAFFRVVSSAFPPRVFQLGDDMMYSLYQRLVLFFFEYYTGVEVGFLCSFCHVSVARKASGKMQSKDLRIIQRAKWLGLEFWSWLGLGFCSHRDLHFSPLYDSQIVGLHFTHSVPWPARKNIIHTFVRNSRNTVY